MLFVHFFKMSKWERYLEKIYFDPAHPASFEGPKRLYNIVKKEGKFNISHSQIKRWIQKKESYSRNKRVKRNFQRGKVIVAGIDDQFDIDLASLVSYADDNDGYKYLLVVIDIFSRYGWVQPLKDKTSAEIIKGFNKILSEGRKPRRVRSDAAKDFTSGAFKDFLKSKGIFQMITHSEKQANYVERFIKTIKSKIFRYMVEKNSARYIDILPKIIDSYNKTFHTGIRMEPINVTQNNENELWWQMYWPQEIYDEKIKKKKIKGIPYKFKVGDRVRTTYIRNPFQREYSSRWTAEIFKISRRYIRQGQPIYNLVDWYDQPLEGTFYQKELQKVEATDEDIFKIEKVIKFRGRGKNKEALIKWLGWPKKFNSWILASNIQK